LIGRLTGGFWSGFIGRLWSWDRDRSRSRCGIRSWRTGGRELSWVKYRSLGGCVGVTRNSGLLSTGAPSWFGSTGSGRSRRVRRSATAAWLWNAHPIVIVRSEPRITDNSLAFIALVATSSLPSSLLTWVTSFRTLTRRCCRCGILRWRSSEWCWCGAARKHLCSALFTIGHRANTHSVNNNQHTRMLVNTRSNCTCAPVHIVEGKLECEHAVALGEVAGKKSARSSWDALVKAIELHINDWRARSNRSHVLPGNFELQLNKPLWKLLDHRSRDDPPKIRLEGCNSTVNIIKASRSDCK